MIDFPDNQKSNSQVVLPGWERVPCPLCSAQEDELLLAQPGDEGETYRLVRCRGCGLGYLNPRPVQEKIGRYYLDEYECYNPPTRFRKSWWRRLKGYAQGLVRRRDLGYPPPPRHYGERILAGLLGPLARWGWDSQTALPYQGKGDMLDFGCGAGWYAYRMQQQGWNVTGIDFSAHAAKQAARHFNLRVLVGSLPHPEVRPESFDLVTMGQVLEHVFQPHEVIEAAAQALRPGGRLVISVPNLASWGFRFFNSHWWPLELPRHLLHFSPLPLRRLLESHGLEVEELTTISRGSWMRRSLARARRQGELRVPFGRLRLGANLLTRWTVWKGQADCLWVQARRPANLLRYASPHSN